MTTELPDWTAYRKLHRFFVIGIVVAVLILILLVYIGTASINDANLAARGPALPNTITVEDVLTLDYPDGYVAARGNDGQSIWIANRQSILDRVQTDAPFEEIEIGQFVLETTVLDRIGTLDALSLSDETGPIFVLRAWLESEGLDALVSGVEGIMSGGRFGAMTTGSFAARNETLDTIILFVDSGKTYTLLRGFAAEGTITEYALVIRAIAATVEYAPPEMED